MIHDLNRPEVPTYYIAWGDGYSACGLNDINNETTTGLPNFETFIDEDAYLARLAELGINVEDTE